MLRDNLDETGATIWMRRGGRGPALFVGDVLTLRGISHHRDSPVRPHVAGYHPSRHPRAAHQRPSLRVARPGLTAARHDMRSSSALTSRVDNTRPIIFPPVSRLANG